VLLAVEKLSATLVGIHRGFITLGQDMSSARCPLWSSNHNHPFPTLGTGRLGQIRGTAPMDQQLLAEVLDLLGVRVATGDEGPGL
jgi:hypothetical protein